MARLISYSASSTFKCCCPLQLYLCNLHYLYWLKNFKKQAVWGDVLKLWYIRNICFLCKLKTVSAWPVLELNFLNLHNCCWIFLVRQFNALFFFLLKHYRDGHTGIFLIVFSGFVFFYSSITLDYSVLGKKVGSVCLFFRIHFKSPAVWEALQNPILFAHL